MGPRTPTTKEGHYIMENEIEVVLMRKFGDEQSDLLDKFERLSLEIQLNRAMQLGRSLSEPGAMVRAPLPLLLPDKVDFLAEPPPMALVSQVRQGRHRGRSTGLKKVLKKLLRPIVGRSSGNNKGGKKQVPDPRDPRVLEEF